MFLDLHSTLRVVFTIYAAFWVTVLVVLFIGVGLLLRRQKRLTEKLHHEAGGH